MHKVVKHTKKFFVALIGFTIVIIGILMIALPGPGVLVIFFGLAVLASEFAWAQTALHKSKHYFSKSTSLFKKTKKNSEPEFAPEPLE